MNDPQYPPRRPGNAYAARDDQNYDLPRRGRPVQEPGDPRGTDMPRHMRLFHYTFFRQWKMIQASKVVLPSTYPIPKDEKPVVWLSFRQDWEPTTSRTFVENAQRGTATLNEIVEPEIGACRIEVPPDIAPMNWRAWRKLSGVKSQTAKRLKELAIRMGGNVNEWRMTFNAIESGDWLAVEGYFDGAWRPIAHPAYQSTMYKVEEGAI